jgi:hypothetical protein
VIRAVLPERSVQLGMGVTIADGGTGVLFSGPACGA